MTEKIDIEDARREIAGGEAQALDVRDEEQWGEAHVAQAIHMPVERLPSELECLDPDMRLIVFADDDGAADEAVASLREHGFEAAVAKGGMKAWIKKAFRTQPTSDPHPETELGGGG
jgi:rhodanese-related sulfurtransferase